MAGARPVIAGLRRALSAAALPGAQGRIEPLADSGLAHVHLRLCGTGLLARVPKQSQVGLAPGAHLAYEAVCFERAAPGGHAPRLHALLPPSDDLPRGALIVDEVPGRPLQLPQDLPALIQSLAALHALALPAPDARGPLLDPADPLAALAVDIEFQALHLPAAGLVPAAREAIDRERSRFLRLLEAPVRPPRHLIAFDAHPGNFIRRDDGRAVLVDLEKARYGAAALDLAHATLYTSTTWDRHSQAVLDDDALQQAATQWLQALAASGIDPGPERVWIVPLRRAMWLWSITWCAKWRAQAGQPRQRLAQGEDWSGELSDAGLVAHVRERVDHYLAAPTITFVCEQADRLERALQT